MRQMMMGDEFKKKDLNMFFLLAYVFGNTYLCGGCSYWFRVVFRSRTECKFLAFVFILYG